MESGNILSQMAQYDFSTPINVTMVFEDSDEESLYHNKIKKEIQIEENESTPGLNEQEETEKISNEIISTNNSSNEEREECEEISKEVVVERQVIQSTNSHEVYTKVHENANTISTNSVLEVGIINNEYVSIINNNIETPSEKTSTDISEIYQQVNDKEAITEYVKDLLNNLSEHLILIMQPYYYYYHKNPNTIMPVELSIQLNKLKGHFFDLSYSTVLSLILPQENNDMFINKFIDKTVADANKVLKWQCGRHHVEPFFNEMVEWARRKRQHIKSISVTSSARMNIENNNILNDNKILKEKLANPPASMTHSKDAAANHINRRSSDTENNTTCIFSYGSPGREISINIDPNTLTTHGQYNGHTKKAAAKKIRPTKTHYPPTTIPAATKACNAKWQPYYSQHNPYVQNNTLHYQVQHRPPPPPYSSNIPNMSPAPESYQQSPNQIQENVQYNMQNYHRNVNAFTVPANNNPNLGSMYNHQNVGHPTPLITSITSLQHPTASQIGRCCMCGKNTNMRCSKCYNFSYCSYLCQELDSGAHKTICGKSNF